VDKTFVFRKAATANYDCESITPLPVEPRQMTGDGFPPSAKSWTEGAMLSVYTKIGHWTARLHSGQNEPLSLQRKDLGFVL